MKADNRATFIPLDYKKIQESLHSGGGLKRATGLIPNTCSVFAASRPFSQMGYARSGTIRVGDEFTSEHVTVRRKETG